MKFKIIVAAVAAFTALSSQAASTNWGVHDTPQETGGNLVAAGSFFDSYSFSLGGAASVTSSVLSFGNIVGGTYGLWSYGTDGVFGTTDDTNVGLWTLSSFAAPVSHTAALTAGSYYYTVSGFATAGSTPYAIASSAVAAPVPEPETYALLGAGLGIVGFVASRRRRDY
jgi:hypothetical protein